jgi:hypothetical protein
MSPDMAPVRDRTAVCAAVSEHGSAAVQLVPPPAGEAYSVVVAADAGLAAARTMPAAAAVVNAAVAATVNDGMRTRIP